jgi:hypothetical protein
MTGKNQFSNLTYNNAGLALLNRLARIPFFFF